MTHEPIPQPVLAALREMHPDPFTQAAVLRLYKEAPGLLDSSTFVALASAYDLTPEQIMAKRHGKES